MLQLASGERMKLSVLVIAAAISFFALDYVKSQFPIDECNFSRLDVSPCNDASTPAPNRYSIFSTRLEPGQSGTSNCVVRSGRTRTFDIVTLDQPQLRIVFSPGFQLEPQERYGNQQLVIYNVQCDENELAFFSLTDLEMENRNCPNPFTNANRCQDVVEVIDDTFGSIENCGSDMSGNVERLLPSTFTVRFRTSDRRRRAGFEGFTVCYRPDLTDMEGCTEAAGSEEESTESPGRRKRDLEEFHNQWRRRLHRLRRQGALFRFQEITVKNGEVVRFRNEQIMIFEADILQPTTVIDDIIFLHTFDVNGTVDGFFKESNFEFSGPGPMVILGGYAYFQLFAIDPRGVIPSEAEAMLIGNLTNAQFELVTPEDDILLPDDELEPPTIDFGPIVGRRRRKRQVETGLFSDEIIRVAIQNENACNPVLRAQSLGILSLVESRDPDRVQRLRDGLAATPTPPSPDGQ